MSILSQATGLLRSDKSSDRVVPPTGYSARLTIFTAAAMAFLAVFALAMSLAAGRLADRWSDALARASTIRISAPAAEIDAQTWAVLTVLEQTPGVDSARALTDEEQRDLLEPWFGPDLPVESLPIPRLVEVIETAEGYDGEGLRQRLAAEMTAKACAKGWPPKRQARCWMITRDGAAPWLRPPRGFACLDGSRWR